MNKLLVLLLVAIADAQEADRVIVPAAIDLDPRGKFILSNVETLTVDWSWRGIEDLITREAPLILKNTTVNAWPAMQKWNTEYFSPYDTLLLAKRSKLKDVIYYNEDGSFHEFLGG
jgi:hypothetical protein